jgi:hypothetical protein
LVVFLLRGTKSGVYAVQGKSKKYTKQGAKIFRNQFYFLQHIEYVFIAKFFSEMFYNMAFSGLPLIDFENVFKLLFL